MIFFIVLHITVTPPGAKASAVPARQPRPNFTGFVGFTIAFNSIALEQTANAGLLLALQSSANCNREIWGETAADA